MNTHRMTASQYFNWFGDSQFVSDELSLKLKRAARNHADQNEINLSKSKNRRIKSCEE